MLHKHVLGLRRIKVHTAGDHHIREPVGDVYEAVVVDVAHLPEGEHAWRQMGGPGLLGIVVVHDAPAGGVPEVQPALGVGRHRPVVVVDHEGLERRHRPTHRPGMGQPVLAGDGAGRAHLGGAVGLDEDGAPPVDHGPLHVVRALGAGMHYEPHGGDVVAVPDRGRQGQQAREVGGDHDGGLNAVALDCRQRGLRVEPAEDHRRDAGEEGSQPCHRAGVVHRADHQVGAVGCEPAESERLEVLDHRCAVREHRGRQVGALGAAGGARCEHKVGKGRHAAGRVLVRPGGKPLIPRRQLVGEPISPAHDRLYSRLVGGLHAARCGLGPHEEDPGIGLRQDVGRFRRGQVETHRDSGCSPEQAAQMGERRLRSILGEHGRTPGRAEVG